MEEEKEIHQTSEVVTPTSEGVVKTTTKRVIKEPEVKTEHPQKVFEKKKSIFRAYQAIWYVLGVIEVLIAFRVLLKLLGADPYSGFSIFIYALSSPFVSPFVGILPISSSGNNVVEWPAFLAMIVYVVVAYGLDRFFQFVKPVTPDEVEEGVDYS